MTTIKSIDRIRNFIDEYQKIEPLSTGHEVVNYSGELFNVDGSTGDPEEVEGHEGSSWKNLLINAAELSSSSCYVTNEEPPSGTSHPNFSVGGHMTPNSDGIVPVGGETYLMPLCKWHNHPARNGKRFQHTESRMILLKGYMQGELAVTFDMRRKGVSNAPYGLLYVDSIDGTWKHKFLTKSDLLGPNTLNLAPYVLFENTKSKEKAPVVKEVNLPG